MNSEGKRSQGSLFARLGSNWLPEKILIKRGEGRFSLKERNSNFYWEAKDFRLDGVELALLPKKEFESVYGFLNGEGQLALTPLSAQGKISLRSPRFVGLQLRRADVEGVFKKKAFKATGKLLPPQKGNIDFDVSGLVGGKLNVKAEGKEISARWRSLSGLKFFSQLRPEILKVTGTAADLGSFWIQPFKGSIEGQFEALSAAKNSLIKDEKPILTPGNIVVLVQIIENGSKITPCLISLGGIGSFVSTT